MFVTQKHVQQFIFYSIQHQRALRACEFLSSIVFVEFAYYYRFVVVANLFRKIVFIAKLLLSKNIDAFVEEWHGNFEFHFK